MSLPGQEKDLHGHQQGRRVPDGYAGREPPEIRHGEGRCPGARGILEEQTSYLEVDLQDRPCPDGQEEGREEVRVGEAADPGSQYGRGAPEESQPDEVHEARPLLLQHGRGDADALGDVVQGEPQDQERPEGRLPEGERGPDGEPLPQIVQPNAQG